MKRKTQEERINEEIDDLLRNPYMKKTIIKLGEGRGRAFKFLTKMREGHKSMEEIVEYVKKEHKKFEKAEKCKT